MFPWHTGFLGTFARKKHILKQFTLWLFLCPVSFHFCFSLVTSRGVGPVALSDCVAAPQVGVQKPDPMSHNVVLHTKADVRAQLGTGVVRPRERKTQLRVSEKAYRLWVPYTDPLLLEVRTWKATEQGGGYDLTSKFLPLFPPAGNDCILLTDRPLSSKPSSRGLAVTEWLLLPHLSLPWGPNPAYPLRSPLREAWILIKKHYGFLE